jgi:hypothetical protein
MVIITNGAQEYPFKVRDTYTVTSAFDNGKYANLHQKISANLFRPLIWVEGGELLRLSESKTVTTPCAWHKVLDFLIGKKVTVTFGAASFECIVSSESILSIDSIAFVLYLTSKDSGDRIA